MNEIEFAVLNRMRVETQQTVWILTPETYTRLPKTETPRPEVPSCEDRLADGVAHPYTRIWWQCWGDGGRTLRILPLAGPQGGSGITSSSVLVSAGGWMVTGVEAVSAPS